MGHSPALTAKFLLCFTLSILHFLCAPPMQPKARQLLTRARGPTCATHPLISQMQTEMRPPVVFLLLWSVFTRNFDAHSALP
ncbi:hypothetical protein B0H19DRAFT_1152432 [Mycena capillaripes]|nr:hypothetical protein B0H19DRAFT_1152432 [Mycena capillaripes]